MGQQQEVQALLQTTTDGFTFTKATPDTVRWHRQNSNKITFRTTMLGSIGILSTGICSSAMHDL